MVICKFYKGNPLTGVCAFHTFGVEFEYTCLSKKVEFKRCPWGGKPWYQPIGYAKSDTPIILPGEANEKDD